MVFWYFGLSRKLAAREGRQRGGRGRERREKNKREREEERMRKFLGVEVWKDRGIRVKRRETGRERQREG